MYLKELSAARARARAHALFAVSPAGIVYKTAPGRYLGPGRTWRAVFHIISAIALRPLCYIKRILFVLHSCILFFKVSVNVFAFSFFFPIKFIPDGGTVARTWEQCTPNDI